MRLRADLQLPLRDFLLDVQLETDAEVVGIYGRSGAGKTSLMQALCGLTPAQGVLEVEDELWLDSRGRTFVPPERRSIGYVPQGGLLFPDRSVLENLCAGRKRCRATGLDFDALLEQVVRTLELEPLLGAWPSELSGGETQRVALARALCSGARLLVLDEPTAALGVEFRRRVLSYLLRVKAEFRIPMLVVSHEPLDHQMLCDEVVVMHRGRVIDQGSPLDVLGRHTQPGDSPDCVIAGTITSADAELTTVAVDGDVSLPFFVAGRIGQVGERALISVPACQVLLATQRPEGLSTLNVLPVRVLGRLDQVSHVSVELQLGTGRILAQLTRAACKRLALQSGDPAYALIKAASVHAIPAGPGGLLPARTNTTSLVAAAARRKRRASA